MSCHRYIPHEIAKAANFHEFILILFSSPDIMDNMVEEGGERSSLSKKTLRRLAQKEKKKKKNKLNKLVSGALGATSKFTRLSKSTLIRLKPLVKGLDVWYVYIFLEPPLFTHWSVFSFYTPDVLFVYMYTCILFV